MKSIFLSLTILLSTITCSFAQEAKSEKIYKLKPAVDIPIIAAGAAFSLYGFTEIYDRDPSSPEDIAKLNKNDLWAIDRPAAGNYNEKASSAADYFMYGAIPLPFLLLFDEDIRQDAGTIGVMFLEAFAITGTFYVGSNMVVSRYRPLAYPGGDAPDSEKLDGGSRNSFMGGHPSVTATAGFFAAKVYSDYHPESNFKYVLYGAAAVATLGNAALRYEAGKHFPTDLAAGIAVGTLSGILVPELHKRRANRTTGWFITPYSGGTASGVNATYRF